MHRWGASVFIILLFFHMARVFLYGAYKYPRELNWIVGVILLILGMFEGFTGYLLPVRPDRLLGDGRRHEHHRERAVRRDDPRRRSCRAARRSGATRCRGSTRCTCSSRRALIFALIGLHLYLVIRLGVTLAAVVEGGRGRRAHRARADAAGARRPRRADHAREAEP